MPAQPDLFSSPSDLPEGLRYQTGFISVEEERGLLDRLSALDLKPFEFQGYTGRRRVIYYGFRYDFSAGKLGEADPIPDWLIPLRDRAAGFAGLATDAFGHVLINEYQPGAPIGWHRDRPQFDDVVGVSLGSPARMRFRLKAGDRWARRDLTLVPRSVYLLRGPVRTQWEHSIPPAQALRYSITFRSLKTETGPGAPARIGR